MAEEPQTPPQPLPHANPVPRQIADQIAAAEAMIAGTYGQPEQPTEQQPPAQPELPMEMPQQPAPTHPEYEDEQTWERKFKSLQGRHETFAKTAQAQQERLNQLEGLLATLQATGKTPQQPEAPRELQAKRLITDAEVDEYGNELLDVMGRRTKEVLSPEIQALNEKIAKLENRVEGATKVIAKTQQGALYTTLAGQVPEWRQINHSPDFKNWLQNLDPYSGKKRHEMLKEAFGRQDSRRVVSFFKGFLTEATGLPSHSSSLGSVSDPATRQRAKQRTTLPRRLRGTR